MATEEKLRNTDITIDYWDRASLALVDSAPGHQEILKPPSGGFLFRFASIWK
jgi:hypothetical protein